MARCDICAEGGFGKRMHFRLAIPERRAMTGFWPWLRRRVCVKCLAQYDRRFLQRLKLLAPDVIADDEPVTQRVCLCCGTVKSVGRWREASKWVDGEGRPTRRARFSLCSSCSKKIYFDDIIVSSNLVDTRAMEELLEELPRAGAELLKRVEGWSPDDAESSAAGAEDFRTGLSLSETCRRAFDFWSGDSGRVAAKAAILGPRRRDYKLHYRLDLLRDMGEEEKAPKREQLCIVRTADEMFASYRI
ncbi:MAG: hypothetical protein QGD94_00715 [Planctomycetia bacterium]|nr:hypothetical protein [Planctomycetia bacterium]